MNAVAPLQIHPHCQWCGTGRLCVPDDDRCRACIEDGILPPVEPLQTGRPDVDAQLRAMTEDARKQRIHESYERRAGNTAWLLLDQLRRTL